MRIDLAEPVAALPSTVFEAVADVDALLAGLAGGRLSVTPAPQPDAWHVVAAVQGLTRRGSLRLAERFAGTGYRLEGEMDGLDLTALLHVSSRPDPAQSDLAVTLALKARSLKGRVLLGSLRMMQDALQTRLQGRLASFARGIEHAQ